MTLKSRSTVTLFISLAALACQSAWAQSPAPSESASAPAGMASSPAAAASAASAPADKPSDTEAYIGRAGDAVIAPLGDLNLVRAKIPEALKEALAAPYAEPPLRECPAIAERIRALDAALGRSHTAAAAVTAPTTTAAAPAPAAAPPAATETPMLRHEAIHGGNALQFIDPPQQPEDVAEQAEHPSRHMGDQIGRAHV